MPTVNVNRHGWLKLATGSQTEMHNDKSSAGHAERRSESDEVAVCPCCYLFTVVIHLPLIGGDKTRPRGEERGGPYRGGRSPTACYTIPYV